MTTILPTEITTVEQAKKLLSDLYNNGESFHCEDDANDICWTTKDQPTKEECDLLNKLMDDIYSLPGNEDRAKPAFDPCGYLLSLDPNYSEE